jgi:hypothetical protein
LLPPRSAQRRNDALFSQPQPKESSMTSIESAAKQDVAATRSGVCAWMANHPFTWGAIACAVGALAVALLAIAL